MELVEEKGLQTVDDSASNHGIAWQGRRHVWLGRVCVIRFGNRTVFVGPHWYCTVFLLSVIIGVGFMFVFRVAAGLHWLHRICGVIAVIGSSQGLLRCALVDPGILRPLPDCPGGAGKHPQMMPSRGDRRCTACLIMQPKGALHCEFCHVCVAGWDHHCPWMGKCIGQSNLTAYWTFMCVGLTSLAYICTVAMVTA